MDHIRIIKRAFSITLNYRVLWIFGILLALTTGGSGGGNGGGGNGSSGSNGSGGGMPNFPGFPSIPQEVINGLIITVICLVCFFILLSLAFTVLRYISEVSLIRMVNDYESTGEKVSVRQGFRMGWSRAALRIFLVDLLFGIVGAVAFILLIGMSLAPLLLWLTKNEGLSVVGTIVTVGMVLLVIFLAIVVGIVVSLVTEFIRRAIVLEDRGVFEGIRRGFSMVTHRLGDVIVMALILFAIGLAWAIVTIPVVILLALAAVAVGGLPALLVGFIASQFMQGAAPWILAGAIGLPIFILVMAAPLLFLNGLMKTFMSSTWTLTFREVQALESVAAQASAAPVEPEGELSEGLTAETDESGEEGSENPPAE